MTRNFSPETFKAVRETEAKFFGSRPVAYTYEGHLPIGEAWSADFPVVPWGNIATGTAFERGRNVVKHYRTNWDRLGVQYIIFFEQIWQTKDGPASPYKGGSSQNNDPDTTAHRDHVHVAHRKGFTYHPPGEPGGEGGTSKDNPLWGIDVSGWQQGISMARVKDEGYDFAIIKATEGPYRDEQTYTNPEYQRQVKGAEDAGLVVGAYHFLVQTPAKAQVEHFLKVVGDPDGKLIAIDFEPYPGYDYPGGLTPSNGTLKAFIAELRSHIGKHPIGIYAGRGFWEAGVPSGAFSSYGADYAWDAYWPLHPRTALGSEIYNMAKQYGWGQRWGGVEPLFWQFASTGKVAGFNLDVNAFRGDREVLLALTKNQEEPPPPPPPPEPPDGRRKWSEAEIRALVRGEIEKSPRVSAGSRRRWFGG